MKETDGITSTVHLTGSVDLTIYGFDKLPPLPEGVTPEVWYDFDDGKVNTYVEVGPDAVKFWTTDLDGIVNTLDLYGSSDVWEDLSDKDREALLEWGKAVHERIDCATYGLMLEAATNSEARATILRYAVENQEEEHD
jgi:hypothetical protein